MKAYGYIRCSGLGQMNGDGPDRQKDAITAFALHKEIEIAGWFIESHTGTDLEGRPEFREMRSALVSNGVRCVIIEKLDRLSRTILIQETIIADFKKNGITLFSATSGEDDLCGSDPTRVLIRQILACFFEYERSMICSKLRAARQRKKAQGIRMEGQKPFGSLPGEAATLQQILNWSSQGYGAEMIAWHFLASGVKSRSGRPWRASTIRKILRREHEPAQR